MPNDEPRWEPPPRVNPIGPEYETEVLIEVREGDDSIAEINEVGVVHMAAHLPNRIDEVADALLALFARDSEGAVETPYVLTKHETDFSWGASGWGAEILLGVAASVAGAGLWEGLKALTGRFIDGPSWDSDLNEQSARTHADKFVDHYFVAGTETQLQESRWEAEAGRFRFTYKTASGNEIEVEIGAVDGHPIIVGRRIRQ